MADFNVAVEQTLKHEGIFSDSPWDAGGKTKYGIIEEVARFWGYKGEIKDLTVEQAREIYKRNYWNKLWLDEVEDQDIANEIFDTGVNCGIMAAACFVQRALNAFNRYGKDWNDVPVDGVIGPITIKELNVAVKKRKQNILKALNVLQGYTYIALAENSERKDEMNINGWFANRIKI